MMVLILFILVTIPLAAGVYLVWSIWWSYVPSTAADDELHRQVAWLNDRQSHRLGDRQITASLSSEDAWRQMIRQGFRLRRQQRRLSSTRVRDRYHPRQRTV